MSFKYYKPARSRLQRSELAVPGSSPEMFEKALNSKADYIFCKNSLINIINVLFIYIIFSSKK